MKRLILLMAIMAFLAPLKAQTLDSTMLCRGIQNYLSRYQQSELQDVYKYFYQNRFGTGHLVTDAQSALRYLDDELKRCDSSLAQPLAVYEYTGADSQHVRVHLIAVIKGWIPADVLNQAFVLSATAPRKVSFSWFDEWQAIVEALRIVAPTLVADEGVVQRLTAMSASNRAVHHSAAFNQAYQAHYRVVRRDIFERDLLPLLHQ